jgi:dUTP pyrophosphatase
MTSVKVAIERLPAGEGLPLPAYQTAGSSGMDVCAAVGEPVVLAPGEVGLISAGFRVAVPPGYEAQVRPRSGLALKFGIAVLNSPGTIDSDYRGPVAIILANLGRQPFTIRRGDRIAQMVICPVVRAEIEEVERVEETARGDGGFGHTGV